MTAHSSHLRHLLITATLPGCLWVTDAELQARLGGKGGATNGTTTSVIDTADPDTDADDGDTGTEPEPVDNDNDGSPEDQDCDDNDATRTPDADELCDGVDNNCDDVVDNDATDASPWYRDDDGDGFVDAASEVVACEAPEGFEAATEFDCDDGDPDISPFALEVLGDELDNNCDGSLSPAAVAAETLPSAGIAPVVLTTGTRSDSEHIVLAWASARCGPEEDEHVCGGTLTWDPANGARWSDAATDDWSLPDLSADRIVTFSYDEVHEPVWGWVHSLGDMTSLHIREREIGGAFDPDFSEEVSWLTSTETSAHLTLQAYDTDSGQHYLGLLCDERQGIYLYRRLMRANTREGAGFDESYRVPTCGLGQDPLGPILLPTSGDVYQISWGADYRSTLNIGFTPVRLLSTPALSGLGLQAALGTDELFVQRCQSASGTSRCEESQSITVTNAKDGDLAYGPTTGETWSCVVEDSGSVSLIRIADFSLRDIWTWTVDSVTDASTCAITTTASGHVVAAIQTAAAELYLVEAQSLLSE